MKAKAVWLLGLSGLAVLTAAGLYKTLPGVESDIREKVTRTLADKGLDDVRAKVDGQTVTLTAMDNDPDSAKQLAQAQAAITGIDDHSDVPGGHWAKVVTQIHVGEVLQSTPHAQLAAAAVPAAADGAAPPVVIDGEKATTIDGVTADKPAVAGGDVLPISSNVAQGCEERIYKAMGTRKLSYVFGSYELTPESQPVLDDVYKAVSTCPASLKVVVAGYTDNAGDAVANQLISRARAQAASDALVARGLSAERVVAVGFGASSPVADNSTPEGRAANRRVVFLVNAG